MNFFNGTNDYSPNKKFIKQIPTLKSSQQSILNEIKNSDYNIRIIESPSQEKNSFKFKSDLGSNTFYKQNNKDEEGKFDIGEIKKTDISSEEFFMRRSQMNYIRKNLSPVKATLSSNANLINNNILNNSMKRIFSAKVNNFANLIKSDLILICNLIQKNSNIINFYKHQFQSEVESTKNNNKLNKTNYLNTSNNSIVSKLSLQNILIQKRCLEIDNETKENFSEIIEKLTENSKNTDLLMNNYKCLVKDELIHKMALENYLNQFLIKKIDDLFFLTNLKNLNENNEFCNIYTESHSKIQNINNFLELLKKLILNKIVDKSMIPLTTEISIKSSNEDYSISQKYNNNKIGYNTNNNTTEPEQYNYCIYNCEYCIKRQRDTNLFEKNVLLTSNSIKSIPEVNELNETMSNSKNAFSKRNSKNISIKVKKKTSDQEEKSNGLIKFDLIKMQSSSENQDEELLHNNSGNNDLNEEYDSNKILEMKTFAEFKNYETENAILNYIKKLHDNMNEKIFKIFFDYFISKYPDEEENNAINSNLIKNIQRNKTKLRSMLLKKNDDGIMSYLFIREEFEKIIKEKEDLNANLSKKNYELQEQIQKFHLNSNELESQIKELKNQLNKKEVESKFEFIKNLDVENKKHLTMVCNKLEKKYKNIESENVKLNMEIDILQTKLKCSAKEKEDYRFKLEFFTNSEERRKKKKKLNESFEDILIEQFDNMKKAYNEELEKTRKEITQLKNEYKKIISKNEIEIDELKNRNLLLYKQIEEINVKLNVN